MQQTERSTSVVEIVYQVITENQSGTYIKVSSDLELMCCNCDALARKEEKKKGMNLGVNE